MSKMINLLVGTAKGIFMYTSNEERKEWSLKGPFLNGWEAYSILGDSRSGSRIIAGTSHAAYGASIRISDDFGESWRQIPEGPGIPQRLDSPLIDIGSLHREVLLSLIRFMPV